MLQVFLGNDAQGAREAILCEIEKIHSNNEHVAVLRFTDISFSALSANEAIFAQNLFGGSNIVVFDGVLDSSLGEQFYLTLSDKQAITNHVFIREISPKKDLRDLFAKIGKIKEFSHPQKLQQKPSFALADTLARRDKKAAWVELMRVRASGGVVEETHGMIFWAVKCLYLSANYPKDEAIKSGVSPSNYWRYLENSKKFLSGELDKKLRDLKNMYHQAHRGEAEFDAMLEQFVLDI